MPFEYPCPGCGATLNIHDMDCEYHDTDIQKIRKAYIDIISVLSAEGAKRQAMDAPPGISYNDMREKVNEILQNQPPEHRGLYREIHDDCLHELKDRNRASEDEEMGGIYLTDSEERAQEIIPTFDPIRTIYETGPVDGAKDYSVYSMVSWTALVGLNWEQTCNFLTEWLEETNSWEELDWGEGNIQQLLDSKQHVHEKDMGWGDYAEIAASHIRQSDREKRIDAQQKVNQIDGKGDYDS